MVVGLARNLYGRFAGDEKQPERRTSGGGQSGSKAFSDRAPVPKDFFGPLTGLGEGAKNVGMTALGLPEAVMLKFFETSQDLQDISGRTYGTAKDAFETVVGVPGTIIEGATAPVGQLSKDVLPLAAIAAAVLLLRK